MEAETLTKIVEIAAKWAEQADTQTGVFSGKKKWEIFDVIFKALLDTVTGKK